MSSLLEVRSSSACRPSSTTSCTSALSAEDEKRLLRELRTKPLPKGWKVYVSRTTGKPYWHNKETNETKWEEPEPAQEMGNSNNLMTQELDVDNRINVETHNVQTAEVTSQQPASNAATHIDNADDTSIAVASQRRKDAFRKKLDDQSREMDLYSLVEEAKSRVISGTGALEAEAMKRREVYERILAKSDTTTLQTEGVTVPTTTSHPTSSRPDVLEPTCGLRVGGGSISALRGLARQAPRSSAWAEPPAHAQSARRLQHLGPC
mmetsp:Transcript_33773/g.89440  ORF Transcript_33773/g.89440 Transcript_33773/m.89440 type:complete len:264 (-) Transcript_33773:9-800(-)